MAYSMRFEAYVYGDRPVQLRPPSVKLSLSANGLVSRPELDEQATSLRLLSLSFPL